MRCALSTRQSVTMDLIDCKRNLNCIKKIQNKKITVPRFDQYSSQFLFSLCHQVEEDEDVQKFHPVF